jgi:hypothetical protein
LLLSSSFHGRSTLRRSDFKERTGSGAAVSLVSLGIMFLLVVSELRSYLTPVTSDHLYVDTARGERIRINVNITFPNMPCAGLKWVRFPHPAAGRKFRCMRACALSA